MNCPPLKPCGYDLQIKMPNCFPKIWVNHIPSGKLSHNELENPPIFNG
jgi:hypothetical protein